MIDQKIIDRLFSEWCGTWGVPDLSKQVSVKASGRLSRSIARCYPQKKKIHLHREVPNSPYEFFREVLCHELAHIAVHELNGNGCRPHGREWKELMRKAGFEPRTRLLVIAPATAPPPKRMLRIRLISSWRQKK